jgi:LacI family transcriptional regulator
MAGSSNGISTVIHGARASRRVLGAVPARVLRTLMDEDKQSGGRNTARIDMRAVARQAGVGLGSVSRVLSGKGPVSGAMLGRVQQAIAKLGYEPNLLAQSLRSRSTRTVGFVISDITNPLLASIVSGAESVLSEAGYSVLLTNSGGRPEIDAARVRLLLQRQVDGLIVLAASENDAATVAALAATDIPVVVIDRDMPAVPKALHVRSDHYLGMHAAVEHLLAFGRRKIALIAGPEMRPAKERVRAFQDAHETRGVQPFSIEYGPLSAARARETTDRLLERKPRPDAIVLGGNQLLEGALTSLQTHRFALGTDVSIVCCDDVPLGRLSSPPIPTIMRDTEGMGRTAASLLLARLGGKPVESQDLPTWFDPRG